MNPTIRIRRAQLRAAMTSQRAQLIAALKEGHRSVYTSGSSKQRTALTGIAGYWAMDTLPGRSGQDYASAVELGGGG